MIALQRPSARRMTATVCQALSLAGLPRSKEISHRRLLHGRAGRRSTDPAVPAKRSIPARAAPALPTARKPAKLKPRGTSSVIAPGRPPVAAGTSVTRLSATVRIAALTKTDRTAPVNDRIGTPAPILSAKRRMSPGHIFGAESVALGNLLRKDVM